MHLLSGELVLNTNQVLSLVKEGTKVRHLFVNRLFSNIDQDCVLFFVNLLLSNVEDALFLGQLVSLAQKRTQILLLLTATGQLLVESRLLLTNIDLES